MPLQSWVEGRSEAPVRGLRLHDLGLDQAFLNVTNLLDVPAWLYTVKDVCYKCPYTLASELPAGESTVLKVNTVYSIKARVYRDNLGQYVSATNRTALECDINKAWQIGEFGIYDLVVQPGKCTTDTYLQPVNIYLPWFVVTAIVIFCFSVYFFLKGVRNSWNARQVVEQVFDNNNDACPKKSKVEEVIPLKKPRIKSVDVFRGLSVIPLIFYLNHGGGYQILEHAVWEGLPIADWPFPWFLWIMGVCVPMGINSSLERNNSRLQMLIFILKRSLLLFVFGIMTNCVSYGLKYESIRFFNVLQRFAIMCLLNASLCALLWPRGTSAIKGRFADLQVMWPQWLVHIPLQILTLCLVFFMPVPGCPTGYLGPGGLSEDMKYFNCTGGTFGYINKLAQNEANFEQNPTTRAVYGVKAFEPEGVFSNLPSLVTVILGIQAGSILVMHKKWKARIWRWVIWGISCILVALILHFTIIPMNKQLWSTSFSLITGGGAFLGLSLFYWVIDVKGWWGGFPFLEPGMNCLTLYVGSRLTAYLWPWHWSIGPMDTHFVLLLDTVWACWLWLLVAKWMYKRNIFISV